MLKSIMSKLTAGAAVCGLALSPVHAQDYAQTYAELYGGQHEITLTQTDLKQVECMALNTYYEARSEPVDGQEAVNHVVMNRVASERFPDTPCEVVYQRNRRGCQFSWVCKGQGPVRNNLAYDLGYEIAYNVYTGKEQDITSGAQYYHATYVSPSWSRVFQRTKKINLHIFYYEEER